MNTAKVYYDDDGNECSIWQMIERCPYWAASRIQEAERLEQAAQHQGAEPVAWQTIIDEYDPPARCTHGTLMSAHNYQIGAGGPERCRIVPLYATPQPQPDWIACSERLPDVDDEDGVGQVLVYDSDGDMDYYDFHTARELVAGGVVTHWKPTGLIRPEPPEDTKYE